MDRAGLGTGPAVTNSTRLWRPVGPDELLLIAKSGMKEFPPRLPEQPVFYPVTTFDYAVKIARDWNVPASGSGFVTEFDVSAEYLAGQRVEQAGGREHEKYWIPAEDLPDFNRSIVGHIRVVKSFPE